MKNLHLRSAAVALGLALLGSLAAARPAQAAPHEFAGVWANLDTNTRHLVRIVAVLTPTGVKVNPYGKCSPNPCDWGSQPLVTYGNHVSDANHKHGTAVYNFGFATAAMTFQLLDAQTMLVHTYTRFLDNSGRQNYHTVERFRKLPIIVDPVPGG